MNIFSNCINGDPLGRFHPNYFYFIHLYEVLSLFMDIFIFCILVFFMKAIP
jgi:hypothetical protein